MMKFRASKTAVIANEPNNGRFDVTMIEPRFRRWPRISTATRRINWSVAAPGFPKRTAAFPVKRRAHVDPYVNLRVNKH
jgi:hypothetical protein